MKTIHTSPKLKDATLCFLIKENASGINEICLAMKKRGFGEGRWNGVGGKVDTKSGETVEDAAIRETQEEILVKPNKLDKVAELTFLFPHNPDWHQLVHTYFVKDWQGEPEESEEMRPQWYSIEKIPYDSMWPDDIFWLPKVIEGSLLRAEFKFGEGDEVLDQAIDIVDSL